MDQRGGRVWIEENPEELRCKQAAWHLPVTNVRWYLLLHFTACTCTRYATYKPAVKNKVDSIERSIQ